MCMLNSAVAALVLYDTHTRLRHVWLIDMSHTTHPCMLPTACNVSPLPACTCLLGLLVVADYVSSIHMSTQDLWHAIRSDKQAVL